MVVYCTLDFVDHIVKLGGGNRGILEVRSDRDERRDEIEDMLLKKCQKIYLDMTQEEFEKEFMSNVVLKALVRNQTRSVQCYNEFNLLRNESEYYVSNCVNPNSLHCYEEGQLSAAFGMLNLNCSNWEDGIKRLNQSELLTVSNEKGSNRFRNWKSILSQQYQVPSNTLIIYDPYLLKNEKSMRRNLLDIMEFGVSSGLNTPYQVSLISNDQYQNKQFILEEINTFVENVRLDANNKLGINIDIQLYVNNRFHDRGVLSNYFWIDSGRSLDLVDNRGNLLSNRKTLIKYNTINTLGYEAFITVVKEISSYCIQDNLCGDKFTNRLLKYNVDNKY